MEIAKKSPLKFTKELAVKVVYWSAKLAVREIVWACEWKRY